VIKIQQVISSEVKGMKNLKIHRFALLVFSLSLTLFSCIPPSSKPLNTELPTTFPQNSKTQTPTQIPVLTVTQEQLFHPTSTPSIYGPILTPTKTIPRLQDITPTTPKTNTSELKSGQDIWRITSTEITRQIIVLGYTISPTWQDFPITYNFLTINFECVTGKSLIELYTKKDMGLTFIHDADGYSDIYVTDHLGEKHLATMIGDCWISIPLLPEKHGFTLFFSNLDPVNLSTSKPLLWRLDQIVFVSERLGNPDIFTMNPDRSEQTPIIKHPAIDIEPAISPDREKITFTSDREGTRDIYLYEFTGKIFTNLTSHPAEDGASVWAPNGNILAFHSIRNGNWDIFHMDISEMNVKNLTQHPASDKFPSWSSSGKNIAFQSNRDGNWEIYSINSDGSNPLRITNNPADDIHPAWSPTDSSLAFWTNRDGFWRLYLYDIETQMLTPITDYANPGKNISPPSWSSDGKKILFSIIRDGNQEIYLVNKDGSEPLRLTKQNAHDYDPDW
jgi:Tol biopolymer transport system component